MVHMRFLKLFVLIVFLSGCIPIMINENNYRGLSDKALQYVKPFDISLVSARVNNSDSLILYEINSDDIKALAHQEKYLWVHLWRPFCSAELCQNVDYFGNLADSYENKGLRLLFISETYDFRDIIKIMKHSWFNHPVFVLQDSYYGHKMRKTRLKLMAALSPDSAGRSKIGFDDYLFKEGNLLYAGGISDNNVLDSLINSD